MSSNASSSISFQSGTLTVFVVSSLIFIRSSFCVVSEDVDQIFSLISKELKKTPGRTLPELVASIENAVGHTCFLFPGAHVYVVFQVSGIHVEHLDQVVDFWASISARCIAYAFVETLR